MRHLVDDDGRQKRALATGMIEDFRALCRSVVDPVLERLGGLGVDNAAELRVRIHRIAEANGLGLFQHQRHEPVGHRFLHQDTLDRRAALSGIAGGTGHGNGRRLVQIGVIEIVEDDQRIVAAQFQRRALVAGFVGNQLADRHTAGEGDDVDIVVDDHFFADVSRPAGHHLEHLRRQASFVKNVSQ